MHHMTQPNEPSRHRNLICLFIGLLSASAVPVTAQLGLADSSLWTYLEDGEPRLGRVVAIGDFDGDGFGDMAAGAHWADAAAYHSGRVHLRRVSPTGVVSSEVLEYCLDPADRGDGFHLGAEIVFGDFDGDGDEDMAVGIPGATVAGESGAGAVCIVEGGPGPLAASSRTKFSQQNLSDTPEQGDAFGLALAAGDLNGDEYADLAIGVPLESVFWDAHERLQAGAVHVLLGGPNGLSTTGEIFLTRETIGVAWDPMQDERFGSSLAIADLAGSPIGELAVGAPYDGSDGILGGSVTVFLGEEETPLVVALAPIAVGGVMDLLGTGTSGDRFGESMAPCDFDGDGWNDLAIGLPGESDLGVETQAGAVMVLYGDSLGLTDSGEQVFFESLFGGNVDDFDRFGESLAAGDFDRDGYCDLAIGSPGDNPLAQANAGKVTVVYGTDTGLKLAGFQLLGMNLFEELAPDDDFGISLAAGKLFEPHGGDDLLIGVPGHVAPDSDGLPQPDTGAVVLVQSIVLHADGFETGDLSAWTVSP